MRAARERQEQSAKGGVAECTGDEHVVCWETVAVEQTPGSGSCAKDANIVCCGVYQLTEGPIATQGTSNVDRHTLTLNADGLPYVRAQ